MSNLSILITGASEADRERLNGLIKFALQADGFHAFHLRDVSTAKHFISFDHLDPNVPSIDMACSNTDLDMYQVLFKISQSKKQKA